MARSRKYAKLATLRFQIQDSEVWKIELLGLYGWYSYRLIASRVFGTNFESVTRTEIARVGRVLHQAGIRVTDGRNGLTVESRRNLRSILSPKNKRLKVAS